MGNTQGSNDAGVDTQAGAEDILKADIRFQHMFLNSIRVLVLC